MSVCVCVCVIGGETVSFSALLLHATKANPKKFHLSPIFLIPFCPPPPPPPPFLCRLRGYRPILHLPQSYLKVHPDRVHHTLQSNLNPHFDRHVKISHG